MLKSTSPTIWALIGPKPGDNNQVLALCEALNWPTVEKRVYYRRGELLSNRFLGPNLVGLDRQRSADLKPPWPDLVISAGRRNEPVARWIRRAARPHRVRLVHLGRPWASLKHFDLIISTPQYQLPGVGNVLHNALPLHRVREELLTASAEQWLPRLKHLPRPYTVMLAGGSSANLVLDHATTLRMRQQAEALARNSGGSLLISTSKRTPTAARQALSHFKDIPTHIYHWRANDPDNPYLAYLALGDQFIVTGESISMLTEACATGKPVHIFCPGKGADAGNPMPRGPQRNARQRFNQVSNKHAPKRWRRDVSAIHSHLINSGRAAWLGEPLIDSDCPPPSNDLDRAVKRVRKLFTHAHPGGRQQNR